ncbi:MAG: ribonuclease H family protein [Promethearchaeota archaeon]|jgi:ribonuclease HI
MKFRLYTDGACQPNPGCGGWAFITYQETHPEKRIVKSGYNDKTTNNRMEIIAVLEGLKYVIRAIKLVASSETHSVTLCSDSKYLLNGIETWMHDWIKNSWKKKNGKNVLNSDLWAEIYALSQEISLKCEHVRGHSGHLENEECDQLAVAQITQNK